MKKTRARLDAVEIRFRPDAAEIRQCLSTLLEKNHLKPGDIDLVMYGDNGDTRSSDRYESLRKKHFPETCSAAFKHICGEYQTSGSFALWLAATIISNNYIPGYLITSGKKYERLSHILIYNSYGDNHSFYLIGKA